MSAKNIAVVTVTRAEYGIMRFILKKILLSNGLNLQLIVSGTHTKPQYGNTIDEIIKDGFRDNIHIVDIPISTNKGYDIGVSFGQGVINFCKCFDTLIPHMILVVGDRY